MELVEREIEIYRCSSCGTLRRETMACCGEPLEPVTVTITYHPPELMSVINSVFDMSSTDLKICRALMAEGEATIDSLTAQMSLNRSTITRRLNHLVELGLIEKESEALEAGGRVNIYSPATLDEIHRTFQLGLYTWLDDAEDLLEELHQERLNRMVDQADTEIVDASD